MDQEKLIDSLQLIDSASPKMAEKIGWNNAIITLLKGGETQKTPMLYIAKHRNLFAVRGRSARGRDVNRDGKTRPAAVGRAGPFFPERTPFFPVHRSLRDLSSLREERIP